jgi:hypothetical protein
VLKTAVKPMPGWPLAGERDIIGFVGEAALLVVGIAHRHFRTQSRTVPRPQVPNDGRGWMSRC